MDDLITNFKGDGSGETELAQSGVADIISSIADKKPVKRSKKEVSEADEAFPSLASKVCTKCGFFRLCDSPFQKGAFIKDGKVKRGIPDFTPEGGWIVVIGDSPSEDFDNAGKATTSSEFVLVLEAFIDEGQIDRLFYIPSLLCRPYEAAENQPDGRVSIKPLKTALKRCWEKWIKPIVDSLKPKAIIAMGPGATHHTIKRLDYFALVGRAFRYGDDGTPVYAAWHHDHTGIDPKKLLPRMSEQLGQILRSIDTIQVAKIEEVANQDYVLGITAKIVAEWFDRVYNHPQLKPLGWDVETTGLDIYRAGFKVGVFSFDHPANPGKPLIVLTEYSFAERIYQREFPMATLPWSQQKLRIEAVLRQVMEDEELPKIGHNLQFDECSVRSYYKWDVKGFYADTMLLNYLLNPDEKGFGGLESLVRKHLPDTPEYWILLDQYKAEYERVNKQPHSGNYLEIPEDILLPYAAFDTVVVTKLYEKLIGIFREHARREDRGGYFVVNRDSADGPVWQTFTLRDYAIKCRSIHHKLCTHLEHIGLHVDHALVEQIYKVYDKERSDLVEQLEKDPLLVEFEADHLHLYISKSGDEAKALKRGEPIRLNWGSGKQVRGFFIDFLRLPILKHTEKGGVCLDESVIEEYAHSEWYVGPDERKTQKPAIGQEPWKCTSAMHLAAWRKAEKFISSFLDPIRSGDVVHSDRLLHVKFKSGSVATGRLAACVDGDTLIETLRGPLPIRFLEPGDFVLTHKLRHRRVLDVFIKCYAEQFLVTFSNGNQIVCTAGHRFYTTDGRWVALRDLSCSDQVVAIGGRTVAVEQAGQTRQANSVVVPRFRAVVLEGEHKSDTIQGSGGSSLCGSEFSSVLWDGCGNDQAQGAGNQSGDNDREQVRFSEPHQGDLAERASRNVRSTGAARKDFEEWLAGAAHAAIGQGRETHGIAQGGLSETLPRRGQVGSMVPGQRSPQEHPAELGRPLRPYRGASCGPEEESRLKGCPGQHGRSDDDAESVGSTAEAGGDAGFRDDDVGDGRSVRDEPLSDQAKLSALRVRGQGRSAEKREAGLLGYVGATLPRARRGLPWVGCEPRDFHQPSIHRSLEVDRVATRFEGDQGIRQRAGQAHLIQLQHSRSAGGTTAAGARSGAHSASQGPHRCWVSSGGLLHPEAECRAGDRRDDSRTAGQHRGGHDYDGLADKGRVQSGSVNRSLSSEGCGDGGCTGSRILKVESVGIREVWDCTIEGDHSYIGNGMLSHNTKPNVQAIPRDGLVKKLYSSRHPDGWMLTRDYSGLEVRVLALFCRDPLLVETFRTGGDVHFSTQLHFFGQAADKKNKTQRSICKQALFGNIFGQGDKGLFELLTAARTVSPATGKPVTMEECKRFNQMIYERYPKVGEWVQFAHHAGINEKWISSAFGFTRGLPEFESHRAYEEAQRTKSWEERRSDKFLSQLGAMISGAKRRSQNTPIQSTAADITTFAAWRTNELLIKKGLDTRVVSVVHDDLWLDVPHRDEMVEASRILAYTMDNFKDWIGEMLDGYDASWIDCPIIGECEVGLNPKDALPTIEEPKWDGTGNLILKGGTNQDGSTIALDWIKDYDQIREICFLKKLALKT